MHHELRKCAIKSVKSFAGHPVKGGGRLTPFRETSKKAYLRPLFMRSGRILELDVTPRDSRLAGVAMDRGRKEVSVLLY